MSKYPLCKVSDTLRHRVFVTGCVAWLIILLQVVLIILDRKGVLVGWEWWMVVFPVLVYVAMYPLGALVGLVLGLYLYSTRE